MRPEELLKLPVLDQVKWAIEESLKLHKEHDSQFWKGSAHMGKSILETIAYVKELNNL